MLAAQEVDHLHHQKQRYDLDAQDVHHLHNLAGIVCELDMIIFYFDMEKVT